MSGSRSRLGSPVWVLLIIGLLSSVPVRAHLLNMSLVAAELDGAGRVTLTLELDLTRTLGSDAAYANFASAAPALTDIKWIPALESAVVATLDGQPLPMRVLSVQPPVDTPREDFLSPYAWPRTQIVMKSAPVSGGEIRFRFLSGFAFEEPIALTMTDIATGMSKNRWLVANQSGPKLAFNAVERAEALPPTQSVEAAGFDAAMMWSYVVQGFIHILPIGLDHLAFVVGMFFAARSMRQLVAQLSLFTLAHTVTLGLSWYRVIEPPIAWVEAFIALSIVWVCTGNLWRRGNASPQYVVVALFGLIHGMGFASALTALGLPEHGFLWALFGFNLGVELGQVCFVLLLALLFGYMVNKPYFFSRVVRPVNAVVALVGLIWVLQRLPVSL